MSEEKQEKPIKKRSGLTNTLKSFKGGKKYKTLDWEVSSSTSENPSNATTNGSESPLLPVLSATFPTETSSSNKNKKRKSTKKKSSTSSKHQKSSDNTSSSYLSVPSSSGGSTSNGSKSRSSSRSLSLELLKDEFLLDTNPTEPQGNKDRSPSHFHHQNMKLKKKQRSSEKLSADSAPFDFSAIPYVPLSPRTEEQLCSEESTTSPQSSSGSGSKELLKPARSRALSENSESTSEPQDRVGGTKKKFHQRFDLPGEVVIDDFICALLVKGALMMQGTMYITHNYLCFYANLGKKTIIAIPFVEILSVKKTKILKSIPNSIEVQTIRKKYNWVSFIHREDAFQLINFRIQHQRKHPSRMDSYPLSDDSLEGSGYFSDPDDFPGSSPLLSPIPFNHQNTGIGNGSRVRSRDSLSGTLLSQTNTNHPDEAPPLSLNHPFQCGHLLKNLVDIPPRYSGEIPLSVQEFYSMFFADSSVGFWNEFHAQLGWENYAVAPWVQSQEGCCFERTAQGQLQQKFSFSSKHNLIKQHHRCRWISPGELLFEMTSQSDESPYYNQFLFESRWTVRKSKTSPNHACQMDVSVYVHFLHDHWLRGMLERNAIESSRDWFEAWISCTTCTAKFLRQEESMPKEQRTPKEEIVVRSIRTTMEARQHRRGMDESSQQYLGTQAGLLAVIRDFVSLLHVNRPLKIIFSVLWIMIAMLLLCNVSLVIYRNGLYSHLDGTLSENSFLNGQYQYLRSLIALSTIDLRNESSSDHQRFPELYQKYSKDQIDLMNQIVHYQSMLLELNETLSLVSQSILSFSLPSQSFDLELSESLLAGTEDCPCYHSNNIPLSPVIATE